MTRNPAIYLDNAATTRVAPEVAAVVDECMLEAYGNPSSAHHAGIEAERRVKTARDQLLDAIGDPGGDRGRLIWTSGGTEGDALGVIGAARALRKVGTHILYSAIEHPAVRESAALLERDGWTSAAIPVSRRGVVEASALEAALTDDTAVVAVMLVNNEIGTINPIAELAAVARARNPRVHVHCDAVQALGKLPIDVAALGADSVAFAAHKLHGPKGVGAVWLRKGARIEPLWAGGGQQDNLRSGTLNVPGIAGMGAAAALAADGLDARRALWARFEAMLVRAAHASGVTALHNGADAPRAPHVVSLGFEGVPAEPLLHVLESRGVLVSAGSACAERSRKPSPVLQAIGLGEAFGTLRFSFGRDTTEDEVARACAVLSAAIADF